MQWRSPATVGSGLLLSRAMKNLTKPALILIFAFTSGVATGQEPIAPEPFPATSSAVQALQIESPITLKQFARNILNDQQPIFTFPWRVAHGRHWKAVVGVTLGTTAMIVLDPYIEPFFHDRARFDSYQTGPLRGRNTTL